MLIIIVYYTIFIIMYSVLIWRMQNEPWICTKQCMLCECPCILLSLLLLLLFCVYYWFFKIIISWFVKYCYEDVIMVLFFFGYFHKQNMVNKYVTYNLCPSVFVNNYPREGTPSMLGDTYVLPFWLLFTPQPSGLEGYCRHGPGGRAGGRAAGRAAAKLAEPISL